MNYLGHLVLSGENEDVLFGNFIGDSIKGNKYQSYNKSIQKGILLHRFIDHYTDHHPACLTGKRRMYSKLPKVSGIVQDILYDHILWLNWKSYFSFEAEDFINSCYDILDSRLDEMPERISFMYSYMRKDNWLYNYQFETGIYNAISGIEKRISPSIDLDEFKHIYKSNMSKYNSEFNEFFTDILLKCNEFLVK